MTVTIFQELTVSNITKKWDTFCENLESRWGDSMQKTLRFNPEFFILTYTSFFFLCLNFCVLFNYGSGFDSSILTFNTVFFALTLIAYFFSKKREYTRIELIIIIFLYTLILFYMFKASYTHYVNFDPVKDISTFRIHQDILYHSAIAESFLAYGKSSHLLNNTDVLFYHTFSHYMISLLSQLVDVPAFFTYTFIYPQVFISLFLFLFLLLSASMRNGDDKIIYIAVSIFSVLLFDLTYTTLHIESQSYFVAATLVLAWLYFSIKFSQSASRGFAASLCYLLISSIMLFFISWAKISTGYVMYILISCVLLMSNLPRKRKLCYLALFAVVFSAAFFCTAPLWNAQKILPFPNSFRLDFFLNFNWIFVISLLPALFLHLTSKNIQVNVGNTSINSLTILILIYLGVLFPYAVLSNPGRDYFLLSGMFFLFLIFTSNMLQFVYTFLADGLGLGWHKVNIKKYISIIVLIIFSTGIAAFYPVGKMVRYQMARYGDSPVAENSKGLMESIFPTSGYTDSFQYQAILKIRELSANDRIKYGVFASNDFFYEKTSSPLTQIFYFPGLTGLVTFGTVYIENNDYYNTRGDKFGRGINYGVGYGIDHLKNTDKIDLQGAKNLAKQQKKEFLFYITSNKLFLIDLNKNNITEILT